MAQIDNLSLKQQVLSEKGREGSEQSQVLAKTLETLNTVYVKMNEKITALNTQKEKSIKFDKLVEETSSAINKTQGDYINNNKELLKLKKELNTDDGNYTKNLTEINTKIQENNGWIQQNGSNYANLLNSMRIYGQQTVESAKKTGIFSGSLSVISDRAKEAGGMGLLFEGAFNGITEGIGGMTKAAWGFVANPIGLILTALVKAGELAYALFKNFAPIMAKVEQVMAAVSAITDSLKNSLIGLLTRASSLGDFFSNFAGSAENAALKAMELKAAQQELNAEMQLQEVRNEKAKKSIEEFTAASQDQTKSEEERLNSLKEAADLETKNFNERKKNAEETYNLAADTLANGKNLTDEEITLLKTKGYEYAQELVARKSITQEELEDLKKAEIEREKIYAEGNTMVRKHLEDKKKLTDEFNADREREVAAEREKNKKIMDDALSLQKQKLNLFIAENASKAKTLDEQLKYEDDYAKKSAAVLKNELNAKKISYTEYQTAIKNLAIDTAAKRAAATVKYANAELDLWMQENQSKITSQTVLTKAIIDEEEKRLAVQRDKMLEILKLEKNVDEQAIKQKQERNEKLTENEIGFLTKSLIINEEFNNQKITNAKTLEDSEANQKKQALKKSQEEAQQQKTQYETEMAEAEGKYELQKQIEENRHKDTLQRLQDLKAKELISEEEYNNSLEEETKTNKNNIASIEKAAQDNKFSLAYQTYNNLATILGKESQASKAMAIAQATMDTYKSAVSAYSAMSGIPIVGPALGAVAAGAAVAAGVANVKKITSTKAPKAEKGALFNIGGNRHSAGGTLFTGADGTQFEAEQGELIGVMNRNAARHFMAFNNAFPAGGASAPNYFAGGGIVSREIAPQSLNTDELAAKIANANRQIPAPVVAVQDIVTQGNSYVQVREAANF